MSSEYVDTKLINCNRLASIEARSNNDSNPAVFTNPLNETVRLNVGDKISIERAFISEVGAGNPSTIEFKGQTTGRNKVSTYTNIVPGSYYYKRSSAYTPKYRLGFYQNITTTEITDQDVDLRDNLAPLVIGYYITTNEYPNYVQQPRRFAQTSDTRDSVPHNYTHYTNRDATTEGLTYNTINTKCICFADWIKRENVTNGIIYKQKVDNTRYTLFIKEKISYTYDDADGNDLHQFPKKFHNGVFAECTYLRVRERIDIEVNKGFNTPSAVANQITNQLTEVKNETIFTIDDATNFPRPITKTIETNTYKPINAQNLYNFNQTTLTSYLQQTLPVTRDNLDGADGQNAIDYIGTFGYIAVKRPEIFEAGRKMANELVPNTPTIYESDGTTVVIETLPDAFEGFQLLTTLSAIAGTTHNIAVNLRINVLYTEENLKKIRDYLDATGLYPELWDNLDSTEHYTDAHLNDPTPPLNLPTFQNSRFLHMNTYITEEIDNSGVCNETLGDDAFKQRVAPNNVEMTTQPIFFKYDDSQRDKFIEPRDYNTSDGLMYGFCSPHEYTNYEPDGTEKKQYFIELHCDTVGGVPADLFTDDVNLLTKDVFFRRRIGFDFHSTAYSTAIITPYSGYSNVDIGTMSTTNDGAGGEVPQSYTGTINHIRSVANDNLTMNLEPYMTMTYIGANNPEITYNTEINRFELSRFHTANNIGNKFKAGDSATNIVSETMTPPARLTKLNEKPPDKDLEAGNTVYKINPRPPQFGYSPTFKPYLRDDSAYRTMMYPATPTDWIAQYNTSGTNRQIFEAYNLNIEPYKIFDSHGGIYIDNWGFDKDNWEDNIWDILGFDYDAVNASATSKNVLTKRVDNENSGALYRPTTNAEVVTTDTKNYVTNKYGAVQYYTSLPYPSCPVNYKAATLTGGTGDNDFWLYVGDDTLNATGFTPPNAQPLELWSEVAILTESTTITATDLQKSVLRPYYTIRSNILEGASAIGGNPTGANLPIISIVDKYSAANDYFMGSPSNLVFTVTKPTSLADITTSIHDSDGRYANVDKTSAVIYRIEKVRRTPVGLIQEILESDEKDKKKK